MNAVTDQVTDFPASHRDTPLPPAASRAAVQQL